VNIYLTERFENGCNYRVNNWALYSCMLYQNTINQAKRKLFSYRERNVYLLHDPLIAT